MNALYRKWRPQDWDGIVGQDHVVQTLRNAIRSDHVVHAYLFAGPRGTGKTSAARILAKAVNCLEESKDVRPCNKCAFCEAISGGRFLDLIEIDAASNTSVDDVRDLRDRINFAPNEAKYKVYIIDEVHMLSAAAFNALLKTLEEPPEHAIFVLATTEVHKIPATVISRCQRHEFRRIPLQTIVGYLERRAEAEGMQVDPGAMEMIARQATGSLRDAISLLDQLVSTGEQVTVERTQLVLGTATSGTLLATMRAWIDSEAGEGVTLINQALDGGADPRQYARQMVEYLRSLLLIQMGNPHLVEMPDEILDEMERQSGQVTSQRLLQGLRAFSQAARDRRSSWQASLPLEMAFVETASVEVDNSKVAPAGPPPGPSPSNTGEAENRAGPSRDDAMPPSGVRPAPDDAPPASSSLPDGQGVDVLTFERMTERWREVLQAARQLDPRAQALLNSCRPLGVESGSLVIGFSSDLLREKMEKGHNLEIACRALEAVFGSRIGIRCVLTENWSVGNNRDYQPPPVEDGGMVATAIRDLGAQVVEVEQLPPDPPSLAEP